jgi:hypothetical protein
MKIAVDFDGTCVTHEYPYVGKDIGAIPVLKELVRQGHRIILNTMRSGPELQAAVKWFEDNEVALYGVNEDPGQKKWTDSPKAFANLYIDDAAVGCPLIYDSEICDKPFANWEQIEELLRCYFFDAKTGLPCF